MRMAALITGVEITAEGTTWAIDALDLPYDIRQRL
jgi:hypothetical protein